MSEKKLPKKEHIKFIEVFKCYKCLKVIKKVAYLDSFGYLCEECAWK